MARAGDKVDAPFAGRSFVRCREGHVKVPIAIEGTATKVASLYVVMIHRLNAANRVGLTAAGDARPM